MSSSAAFDDDEVDFLGGGATFNNNNNNNNNEEEEAAAAAGTAAPTSATEMRQTTSAVAAVTAAGVTGRRMSQSLSTIGSKTITSTMTHPTSKQQQEQQQQDKNELEVTTAGRSSKKPASSSSSNETTKTTTTKRRGKKVKSVVSSVARKLPSTSSCVVPGGVAVAAAAQQQQQQQPDGATTTPFGTGVMAAAAAVAARSGGGGGKSNKKRSSVGFVSSTTNTTTNTTNTTTGTGTTTATSFGMSGGGGGGGSKKNAKQTKPPPKSKKNTSKYQKSGSGSAGKTTRRATQQRRTPRTSSSSSFYGVVSGAVVVRDLDDTRLVNPLAEWPEAAQLGYSFVAATATTTTPTTTTTTTTATTTTNSSSSGGIEDYQQQQQQQEQQQRSKKDANKATEHASEILPLMDLWHPIPDTYSIAYQARLLGFDIKPLTPPPPPPPPPTTTTTTQTTTTTTTTTTNYNPIPLPKHLTFLRDDSIYFIPPLGKFATQIWQQQQQHNHPTSSLLLLPDEDVAVLGHEVDPLYEGLVLGVPQQQQQPPSTTTPTTRPPTTAQQARLGAAFGWAKVTLMKETLAMARSLLSSVLQQQQQQQQRNQQQQKHDSITIPPEWTVCTWKEFETRFPATKTNYPSTYSALCILPRPLPPPRKQPPQQQQPFQNQNDNNTDTTTANNNNNNNNDNSDSNVEELEVPSVRPIVIVWYMFGWYQYTPKHSGLILQLIDISLPSQSSVFHGGGGAAAATTTTTATAAARKTTLTLDELVVVLMALSLTFDHARAANVRYALAEKTPTHIQPILKTYFRMVESTVSTTTNNNIAAAAAAAATSPATTTTTTLAQPSSLPPPQRHRMVADLQKCSSRYTILNLQQQVLLATTGITTDWTLPLPLSTPWAAAAVEQPATASSSSSSTTTTAEQQQQQQHPTLLLRSIVRFPNENDARAMTNPNPSDRLKRPFTRKPSFSYTGASLPARRLSVSVTVRLDDKDNDNPNKTLEFFRTDPTQLLEAEKIQIPRVYEELELDVLRTFAIPNQHHPTPVVEVATARDSTTAPQEAEEDEIFRLIKKNQTQVECLERDVEPKLRRLLACVVEERLQFEQSDPWATAEEEKRIHAEFRKMQANREQKFLEQQKQLEQDMDAVCSICNDGEVTPDNQILFCDTCDVPVHQMCYGVEQIPTGDYHCIACCYLGRDKEGRQKYLDRDKGMATPLPIVCELCPQKRGAFLRTDIKTDDPNGKWVHAVCAKWQGLAFVQKSKPDLVEDVTNFKTFFSREGVQCELCRSTRGCFNKCAVTDCPKWFHVTCARSVGTCQVTHGEDCHGDVPANPWSLRCRDHSDLSKKDKPNKTTVSVEELIELAKTLPQEPIPEPEPEPEPEMVPFNKATREQQIKLLNDPKYEKALITELTMHRVIGLRCEICDATCENAKDFIRCSQCREAICRDCSLDVDKLESGGSTNIKCLVCKSQNTTKKTSSGEEVATSARPRCAACYCPHGPLRPCFAKPVNPGKWKNKQAAYERSLFCKAKWIHFLCGVWNPKVFWSLEHPGKFDLVNVIMSHGSGYIESAHPCMVCGKSFGLKLRCEHPGCCRKNGLNCYFHVTCARHAGLEVTHPDGTEDDPENRDGHWVLKCYRHASNVFNLRANLEDLYEIEKVRLDKKQKKDDARLTFQDGSKIMNAAILVVKTLGWAWRWAEWWVDYDSSWEPLLEEWEKEEDMTNEQLRKVHSTRESRCTDARKCRLVAFGAALRNRMYDDGDDFDRVALDRALRAVLNTKSLVGPLYKHEINFHAEWLGRAYRSKSRLLFLGDDKIDVEEGGFCLNMKDKSRKYEVDVTKVPGRGVLDNSGIYEATVDDVDDFLQTEVLANQMDKVTPNPSEAKSWSKDITPKAIKTAGRKRKHNSAHRVGEEAEGEGKAEPMKRQRRVPSYRMDASEQGIASHGEIQGVHRGQDESAGTEAMAAPPIHQSRSRSLANLENDNRGRADDSVPVVSIGNMRRASDGSDPNIIAEPISTVVRSLPAVAGQEDGLEKNKPEAFPSLAIATEASKDEPLLPGSNTAAKKRGRGRPPKAKNPSDQKECGPLESVDSATVPAVARGSNKTLVDEVDPDADFGFRGFGNECDNSVDEAGSSKQVSNAEKPPKLKATRTIVKSTDSTGLSGQLNRQLGTSGTAVVPGHSAIRLMRRQISSSERNDTNKVLRSVCKIRGSDASEPSENSSEDVLRNDQTVHTQSRPGECDLGSALPQEVKPQGITDTTSVGNAGSGALGSPAPVLGRSQLLQQEEADIGKRTRRSKPRLLPQFEEEV